MSPAEYRPKDLLILVLPLWPVDSKWTESALASDRRRIFGLRALVDEWKGNIVVVHDRPDPPPDEAPVDVTHVLQPLLSQKLLGIATGGGIGKVVAPSRSVATIRVAPLETWLAQEILEAKRTWLKPAYLRSPAFDPTVKCLVSGIGLTEFSPRSDTFMDMVLQQLQHDEIVFEVHADCPRLRAAQVSGSAFCWPDAKPHGLGSMGLGARLLGLWRTLGFRPPLTAKGPSGR